MVSTSASRACGARQTPLREPRPPTPQLYWGWSTFAAGGELTVSVRATASMHGPLRVLRVAGVGTRTLVRWLQVPEFKAAYHKARREAFGQATARLQQASGAAVSTILKIMLDQNAPVSSRLRAAVSVVDHAAKAIEIEEIEARVSELERAAEAAKQAR
jgi:hypothetical protein